LKDWPGEVLRLNMLKTHYRSPIDWTLRGLEETKRTLDRWYDAVGEVEATTIAPSVLDALGDDLNISPVVAELHRLAHPAVAGVAMAGLTRAGQLPAPGILKASANILGLLTLTGSAWRAQETKINAVNASAVDILISARNEARARKDFKESDRIRDELAAMGVVIKDSKEGTTWEIAR
jgi:cysteinyl-tRNA synthetase